MRLEAVGKRYGLRMPWVIQDVSLDLAPGRLVRVEGRNGSGKSTLLRVAAGISLPSAGRVTGRPHTGYVPERFPPALPFTGRDYLAHLGRVHGLQAGALAARIDDCLDRLGAADHAGQPLRTMSKGMCQKIAIAQALLAQPGLLVLDEAWTGLDQAARDALDAAVAERLANGGRVMFVDHDQRRLSSLVHERWQIDHGRVAVARGSEPPATTTVQSRGTAIIELSGVSPALAEALEQLAGVRSVFAEAGRTVVCADADASDAVLRTALAGGSSAHVITVRQTHEVPQ
jgi:ABC-2 type transport system ATP-binding protein